MKEITSCETWTKELREASLVVQAAKKVKKACRTW